MWHFGKWRPAAVFLAISCAGWAVPSSAIAEIKVVASIKPLHSLVAAVMEGAGTPELLVKGAASPHTYSLRPSDARAINAADMLLRVSEAVEPFTVKLVKSLPKRVEVVTLQDAAGLKLLKRRSGIGFEAHTHGKTKHGHSHGRDDAPGSVDGHFWLDPDNAKVMVRRIASALTAKDAANAALYRRNADALNAKLDTLAAELDRELATVSGKPYIVFHDAFQYLESRYRLNAVGSISISPDIPPSAKRLTELRHKIASLGAICVFAEPQFDTRLVDTLREGTSARTGILDAEGGRLEPGPDLYFTLMRDLSKELTRCLGAH